MRGADLVLVVVPSHAFTETLRALAPLRPVHAGVAWAAKGFEPGSGRFLHEVAGDLLGPDVPLAVVTGRSEEHTSELQSLMRISYAVFCLKKKKDKIGHATR